MTWRPFQRTTMEAASKTRWRPFHRTKLDDNERFVDYFHVNLNDYILFFRFLLLYRVEDRAKPELRWCGGRTWRKTARWRTPCSSSRTRISGSSWPTSQELRKFFSCVGNCNDVLPPDATCRVPIDLLLDPWNLFNQWRDVTWPIKLWSLFDIKMMLSLMKSKELLQPK